MTKKEYYKEHYKMWNWLSENPTKTKEDYFKSKEIPLKERPVSHCYLCQVSIVCIRCPLFQKFGFSCKPGSLYYLWLKSCFAGNKKQSKEYALLIRDCVKGLF